MIVFFALAALAADEPLVSVEVGGDVKAFAVAVFPYDHVLMPSDPLGQGVFDQRTKVDVDIGKLLTFELHNTVTMLVPGELGAGGLASTGAGAQAAEAVDLSWQAANGDALHLRGRIDRLSGRVSVTGLDVTLGRQPVTFGSALMFTPLDLVNPFTPAVIDQEYKPGVDALRVDVYPSFSSQITVVGAYAGSWDLPGFVIAGFGKGTIGLWDVGGFAGLVHQDVVLGLSLVGAVGPVGVHTEATFTLPSTDEDPFVRAVAGASWRATDKTMLTGELYLQTVGAGSPDGYFERALRERWVRGELWTLGRYYAGIAVSQEITPTLFASAALLANLGDPSAFFAPALSWSVAENADVGAGAYVGLGARPEGLELQSELGVSPITGFLQMKAYF